MMRAVTDDQLPLQSLYRWERERPSRIYLSQPLGGSLRNWTWPQAANEARRMAAWLKAQNWEPGSRVAILSKNCAWWMMADFATWMAGYVSVPVYPSLRPDSVRQILEHSEAKGCFLGATDDKEMASLGLPAGLPRVALPTASPVSGPTWEGIVAGHEPIAGNPTRAAGDLATIIYTSGTTGRPKGVMHSFGAFSLQAWALAQVIDLHKEHRVLSYLPLAHIVERCGLELPSLLLGWHVYFTEGIDTFVTDLRRAQPTIFLSVPRLLLKFQQGVFQKLPPHKLDRLLRVPVVRSMIKRRILNQLGLGTVRHAACGAAPLPLEILAWYRDLGLNLAEGFGLTEAMITHLPGTGKVRPGYVGPALPGVEQKRTEEGELLLRSPLNMLGYFKDQEASRAAFTEDGFFRTGDLVEIDSDGQLKIIGRVKEQFKTSKGKYVAPAPIEGKLVAHPDVESCCLIGAGLPSPVAVIVLSPEARQRCTDPAARRELEQSLHARLEHVNAQLDPHERVKFLAVVDEPWTIANGLITPSLKIRRTPLESRYQPRIKDWHSQGRPIIWEKPPGAAGSANTRTAGFGSNAAD